jgi:hypothetical protein
VTNKGPELKLEELSVWLATSGEDSSIGVGVGSSVAGAIV